ncbi:MAG: diacylglycerol kinase family protein [Cytophagaceae bacterium]
MKPIVDIKKSLISFKFAWKGIIELARIENNFKVHILSATAVIALSAYFEITKTEWLFVISGIAAVMITEAINTCIEKIIDKISPDYNKEAGQIKDIAAASVLLSALYSVIIAFIIFIPYIFQ